MLELLGKPFDLGIYQRAFIACMIIGFANGYLSALVLLHRSPLKLAALSHSILPGAALSILFFGLSGISVYFGAVICAVSTGILAIYFAKDTVLSTDTILAILYTGFFSVGILLVNYLEMNQALEHWLLGNILALSNWDLLTSSVIGFIVVSMVSIFRRPILLTLYEPEVARTLSVPVKITQYGIFVGMILVLVTTLQAVGCVLAIGLIVTPAAVIRTFTNSSGYLFLFSGLLGSFGATTGLILSYHLDMPAGATIILVFTLIFLTRFIFNYLFNSCYNLKSKFS